MKALLIGLICFMAWAAPRAEAQSLSCLVRAVHATKGPQAMDPRLGGLSSSLKSSFSAYKSFKLLDSRDLRVAKGGTQSMKLPGGLSLSLTFKERKGKQNTFILRIPPKLRGLNASLDEGGTFFQVLKPYEGGIMIIPITCSSR